ncbi:endonuclease/exonuclease/phosphatase family protein [Paenibacillus sp. MBLB4367]|uniref:endonuclease/exonuclease/phosphatase family protein n=1 Tax=Paenibacillus sp. MBLB4367 TaxID=3384767 RepID=UPI003907F5D7
MESKSFIRKETAGNRRLEETMMPKKATPEPAFALDPASYEQAVQEEAPGGSALDFTLEVANRIPLAVDNPIEGHEADFSVRIWVKGAPDSWEAYEFVAAYDIRDEKESGWKLGIQENGAWYWTASNGAERYDYRPTPVRQSIRDGGWHQLAFVYGGRTKEARLYYDGRNVAIYNTEKVPAINASLQLSIGGKPQGDLSEWHTFNGMIGPMDVYACRLTDDEVERDFAAARSEEPNGELAAAGREASSKQDGIVSELKVMSFNIWHGGNETGRETGPARVVDLIREVDADIVCLQETYGSGPRIADALGYYMYLSSTNLSILSRYPIEETRPVFVSFHCGLAGIRLSDRQRIVVSSLWLHWLPDYWSDFLKPERMPLAAIMEGERDKRLAEMQAILAELGAVTWEADDTPVLLCGDYNNGSHLDWTEASASHHNGYAVEWPVSKLLADSGYKDSFREVHDDPVQEPGFTWSPRFKESMQDRIDYIYYKGAKLQASGSRVIDTHPVSFPSDHAAVVTTFRVSE